MDALSKLLPQLTRSTSLDEPIQILIEELLVEYLMTQEPTANPRPMYGGTIFELEVDNPKSRIGGVYGYANHVSIEFAKGTFLSDPHGVLEGSGKYRRHIKLFRLSDIEDKHCCGYLDLAIAHYYAGKERPTAI